LYRKREYPGWFCEYVNEEPIPRLTNDQVQKLVEEDIAEVFNTKPRVPRKYITAHAEENKAAIEQLMGAQQAPTAPTAPPVPAGFEAPPFDDKIPDFV
jgi:hypothetical protein